MSSESSIIEKPTAPNVSTYVQPKLSGGRKALLLFLFCFAEYMDSFISSALFPATNALQKDLNIRDNEITWEFSAYSATFAAFLLISGRVSDIYSAKWTFIVGSACVGLFSLGCGFVKDKVGMFILRAFSGIAAAMTVPSALALIVEWFPDPIEQQRGIALFGGSSATGNVSGIIFGAFFTQWASWKWIFYLTTMMGVPIAIISLLTVPPSAPRTHIPSLRRLDIPGVSIITAAMIVFIYAVTSGSVDGWGSGKVLAPLIVSIAAVVAFFIVEAKLPAEIASLPPRTWFYPNVGILVAIGLLPFLWWCSLFYQLMPLFQTDYHWGTVMTAVHFLPTGVFSAIVAVFSSNFIKYVDPKWTILAGLTLVFIASMILPFANTSTKYWSHLFPAFTIGTIGNMTYYTNANIAIFMNTPPVIAGTIGAMFNAALQLGLALGLAVITSIQTSENQKEIAKGHSAGYVGVRDAYWFVVAWVAITIIAHLVFYKIVKPPVPDTEAGVTTTSTSEGSVVTVGGEAAETKL